LLCEGWEKINGRGEDPMKAEYIRYARRKRSARAAKTGARYLILILVSLFFLFPIFWIVVTAFKQPGDYFQFPPVWFPKEPTLIHFKSVQTTGVGGYTALKNSFIINIASTITSIVLGSMAAYAMARFKTGGKNFSFWVLSQRMLPPIAIIFPIFLVMRTFHWVDTYQCMILVYTAVNLPFVIWMLRSYFLEVPTEVEESALIDGCTRLGALFRVIIPMSLPGMIATAVLAYIFTWTEFLFALILSRTDVFTVPVALSAYFGSEAQFWGEVGVLSFLSIVPVFVMGLLVQKHLARGLTLGAVKG
jgi:multiple sugar transport system permease protein